METVSVVNRTMELSQCNGSWVFNRDYDCWCLEDVLYSPVAAVPKFQRLSIFVPARLMEPGGQVLPAARSVPVVFANNAAGYMQMPPVWLGGPHCNAEQYLKAGYVYVTCGCRGRESKDGNGTLAGKLPATLVDLKTALRFLRHNRAALPGDWDRVISVGCSAGGAMSSLLALTGDHPDYLPWLRENGAFLEESDSVFAAQIYCPITDLEHADLAYEWMFQADKTCEDSPAGPAETMTPFKEALSRQLARQYVDYFNSLDLRSPDTGTPLRLNEDGRSGSGYDYLMARLSDAATKHLRLLEQGALPGQPTPEDYLAGRYTQMVPAPSPAPAPRGPSLGDLVCRPPEGEPCPLPEPPMVPVPGTEKGGWLHWDGTNATVSDLDRYVLCHRRRMKPCTAFDKLSMDSGENQAFGTPEADCQHFSSALFRALEALKEDWPREYNRYCNAFAAACDDDALQSRIRLANPLRFIGTGEPCRQAAHYRIRVGAQDADTAFTVSMVLALRLQNAGFDSVDYALVWDQPHCEADYPGEVCEWIRHICGHRQDI